MRAEGPISTTGRVPTTVPHCPCDSYNNFVRTCLGNLRAGRPNLTALGQRCRAERPQIHQIRANCGANRRVPGSWQGRARPPTTMSGGIARRIAPSPAGNPSRRKRRLTVPGRIETRGKKCHNHDCHDGARDAILIQLLIIRPPARAASGPPPGPRATREAEEVCT